LKNAGCDKSTQRTQAMHARPSASFPGSSEANLRPDSYLMQQRGQPGIPVLGNLDPRNMRSRQRMPLADFLCHRNMS
jgi:hypothetical protein